MINFVCLLFCISLVILLLLLLNYAVFDVVDDSTFVVDCCFDVDVNMITYLCYGIWKVLLLLFCLLLSYHPIFLITYKINS